MTSTTPITATCPCTLFGSSLPKNPSVNDGHAVELGVRFHPDVNGYVTGIRFYKAGGNTGTHLGSLWTDTGQLLASATFGNESTSGWQTVTFSRPVPVSAGATYIAAYHTDVGRYAADAGYFTSGVDSGPLHAPASSPGAGNGVYIYSPAPAFPASDLGATNFWVDLTFSP